MHIEYRRKKMMLALPIERLVSSSSSSTNNTNNNNSRMSQDSDSSCGGSCDENETKSTSPNSNHNLAAAAAISIINLNNNVEESNNVTVKVESPNSINKRKFTAGCDDDGDGKEEEEEDHPGHEKSNNNDEDVVVDVDGDCCDLVKASTSNNNQTFINNPHRHHHHFHQQSSSPLFSPGTTVSSSSSSSSPMPSYAFHNNGFSFKPFSPLFKQEGPFLSQEPTPGLNLTTSDENNKRNLKFSIEDILRPDFGLSRFQLVVQHHHQQQSVKSKSHHHKGLTPRTPLTSSTTSLGPGSRGSGGGGSSSSVSSLDGHRPFTPYSRASNSSSKVSTVNSKAAGGQPPSTTTKTTTSRPFQFSSHPTSIGEEYHSEDSNGSSCTSSRREEVVDDQKVNPPVPEGPLLWPAWVYCTRYSDRPSSGESPLPTSTRSVDVEGPRSRRIRKSPREIPEEKRPRTAFTAEQLSKLKQEFDENRYLNEKRRQDLARELKLNENQIKIWFQNKRAKLKKSTGTKNGLARQLMAQGLYNHSTVPVDEDDEFMMDLM